MDSTYTTHHIPLLHLKRMYQFLRPQIDLAFARCLEHQQWILGPEVSELEHAVATYLGVSHCIGTSSGTEALVIALRTLALQKKHAEFFDKEDLIIVPSFTFTATGEAVLRAGATPVFVDISPHTYTIDPESIYQYLTSPRNGKVVGIIPVHLYGQSCDMARILEIAEQYELFVLEDVAQAFGGMWNQRRLGSIGTIGAFSFFPSKNLGAMGDGGMIATNDSAIADCVRLLTTHGGKDKYNVDHLGYNARLDTLQAAVLLAKFPFLEKFNDQRRECARQYKAGLRSLKNVRLPGEAPYAFHVYHQYTLAVHSGLRDSCKNFLKQHGVESTVYYPVPLHRMPVFRNALRSQTLACTEQATKEVLSIPIDPLQTEEENRYVIDRLNEWAQ